MADDDAEPGKTDTSDKSPKPGEGSPGGGGWLSGLDTDTQELAKARGWDGKPDEIIGKVVTSYRELQSTMGNRVAVPKDDAPDEEREKFYSAIGRPEKPEGYEFNLPEGYPEELPYDKEFAEKFKGIFHKAGVPAKMADQIHGAFALEMAGIAKQQVERIKAEVEGAHDALVKDWGPPDSDTHKAAIVSMNKALDKFGLREVFQAKGILLDDNTIVDAQVAQAFKTIGETMFKEDDLEGDGNRGSGGDKNPWKAESLNTGEQTRLVRAAKAGSKADRQRVAKLIREAGKDPNNYFQRGSY